MEDIRKDESKPLSIDELTYEQRAELGLQLLESLPTPLLAVVARKLEPLLYRDFVGRLPMEIASHILGWTDVRTVGRAASVSKKWHSIASENIIWKAFFVRNGWRVNSSLLGIQTLASMSSVSSNQSSRSALHLSRQPTSAYSASPSNHYLSITSPYRQNFSKTTSRILFESQRQPTIDVPRESSSVSSVSLMVSSASALPIHEDDATVLSHGSSMQTSSTESRFNAPIGSTDISRINTQMTGISLSTSHIRCLPSPVLYSSLDSGLHGSRYENSSQVNWRHIYHQRHILANNWKYGVYNARDFVAHDEAVYCLQFDEDQIITGSRDSKVKIWCLTTGALKHTLTGHSASVLYLQFIGNKLITGSSDHTMILWDLATFQITRRFIGHSESVLHLCFDKNVLVSASKDRTIKIWDIHDGTLMRTLVGHSAAVNSVQFSLRYIVSGSGDRCVKVWSMETGEIVRTLTGHTRGVACIYYKGDTVISGSSGS